MTNDTPNSENNDGNGGGKPVAKNHDVALAVRSFSRDYISTQTDRAKHDEKTLFWARIAGTGVLVYTGITLVIAAAGIAAAIYGNQQAIATRESYAEVQRPFVIMTGLQIRQHLIPMPYWFFNVMAQNSGNTPTKDMRYIVLTTYGNPEDPEESFRNPRPPTWVARITLPPHFNGPLHFGQNGIPVNSFKQQVEQHKWWFIYGTAHYFDRFESSKEHITKFCYGVGAWIDDKNEPGYEPCLFWNCADDDCEADKLNYEKRQAEMRAEEQRQKMTPPEPNAPTPK
jgi:hypothetical protein